MPKAKSENSFSVRYKSGDKLAKYKHGLAARNREALEQLAKRHCPRGYRILAIYWWHDKTTWKIWGNGENKTFEQCWDDEGCEIAFRE